MKNHLGIFSDFGFDLPLEQRLSLIKEAGFTSTIMWLGEEALTRSDIPKLIRDANLYLDHAHASYDDANLIWSTMPDEQAKIKTYYRNCITFCSKHKIPYLVVHPSKSSSPPPVTISGLKIFRDLTLFSKEKNVKIAIENTRKNTYVDFILGHIKSKNIGLCYDTSHDNLYGDPTFRIMKKRAKRIFITHISDNSGEKDDHILPWKGTFNWEKFASMFSCIPYKGVLTFEVFPEKKYNKPSDFLHAAVQTAQKLYTMC